MMLRQFEKRWFEWERWNDYEQHCRQRRLEQDLRYGVLYDTVWKNNF